MFRLSVTVVVALVLCNTSILADTPITLKCPWGAGESWKSNGSYYGEGKHTGTDAYCVDFNWYKEANQSGTDDDGKPILAAASGKVVTSGWHSEYGWNVRIDHGNGVTTHYAHFHEAPFVTNGENVVVGQAIGLCGGTPSYSPHLHFGVFVNGQSTEPNPLDNQSMEANKTFVSGNSNVIDQEFAGNGGSTNFGTVLQEVDWFGNYDAWAPANLYDQTYHTCNTTYIRDYTGGVFGRSAIVYDALGGARRAFTIRTGFWSDGQGHGWSENDGPSGCFGMPLTDEYELGTGHARQDFQLGYLEYIQDRQPSEVTIEGYGLVNGFATYAPGWTDNGWNNQCSYIFSDCYGRNGARVSIGCALQRVTENWQGTAYHTQRYDFGTHGQGMIVYDPESWNDAWSSHPGNNRAYYLSGDFYDVWTTTSTGPWELGAPTTDRVGNTQYFKYGRMVDDEGVIRAYDREGHELWHSQFGAAGGLGPLVEGHADLACMYGGGSTVHIPVWLSDGEQFDLDGDFSGWWGATSWPVGNIRHVLGGDFSGDGLDDVAEVYDYGIVGGQYLTRVHMFLSSGSHFSLSGWITGWWSSTGGYDADRVVHAAAGDFNGDGKCDIALLYHYGGNHTKVHVLKSTGSSFTFHTAWDVYDYNASCVVGFVAGRFNNDARYDLALVYNYGSAQTRIHVLTANSGGTSFTMSGGGQGWWRSTSWPAQHMVQVVAGDLDNDGYDEIVDVYNYPNTHTRLHVWHSTGSSFTLSGGSLGWWHSDGYYALNVKRAAAGDFDGDGKCDVTLAYQYPSSTRFHVFLSTGSSFTYQGNGGWWSSTSFPLDYVYGMAAGHFNAIGGAAKIAQPEEGPETLPTAFTLNQNYPNPFNPVTTISYSLLEATNVRLDIYNILGQKVQTLVDEYQTAGEHTVAWDASRRASGIYFYRVRAGDCEESKKMILLK